MTGSRIPQPEADSVSPLVRLDASDIQATGTTRIEDFLNQLPQVFADQNITVNNSLTTAIVPGIATVDLRGLGPERTLVLIDGKRLMPGDPTSGSIAPDLNFIPDALVDHVEVVTGGQSSVYGSDAIAGAVNFIMRRDFSGIEVDATTGAYNHQNSQTGIQQLLAASGAAIPPHNIFDGFEGEATLAAGMNTDDGKGNISVYAGYRASESVTQGSRDFSACPLEASGNGLACSGSSRSTPLGHFYVLDPSFNVVNELTLDQSGPGNTLRPFDYATDTFNYAPYQYFQRPDSRYVAGAFAHYSLTPSVELYADAMYMFDRTYTQLASSGLFASSLFSVSCDNPMLSADEVQQFCTNAGVPPGGQAQLAIGRRDLSAGGRQAEMTHSDYRLLAGARGNIDGWHYDVSAQYSIVDIAQYDLHDVSLARAADAIDVIKNTSGNLVCASGDPGCVPYDVFAIDGITPGAISYLDVHAKATGGTSETVVSGNVAGDLGQFGVLSPWAKDPVGVAFGSEYRRETLSYAPDAELASGDLSSVGFSSPPVNGAFDVGEAYAEFRAPLVQGDTFLLKSITLSGSYRFSRYSNAGDAQTHKIGGEWALGDDVRFRASFDRAVRAPNVVELFTPQTLSSGGLDHDPCAGTDPLANDPEATESNCARTGVTSMQYGKIASSADGYNALIGGNADLKPEAANTLTFGTVITPRAIEGLNVSIDYYDIKIDNVISTLDPDLVIESCLQTGDPRLCGLVHRAPLTGSLWLGTGGYVSNINENVAFLETRGVDFDASYATDLPSWNGRHPGSASVMMLGTWTNAFTTAPQPGALSYDCAGLFGSLCGDPTPRWRHLIRATWYSPWDFDVALTWRYISGVQIAAASSNPELSSPFGPADRYLGARSYIDLAATWRVGDSLELRAGIQNLFDRDPPLFGFDYANGVASDANTYPGVYDTLGRRIFVGLTYKT